MPRNSDGTPEPEANGLEMPWYKCWWKDEKVISNGWPLSAKGLFHELICLQWRSGSLPADPKQIRKLVGVKPALWREAWVFVAPHFPRGDDGRRRNARQDQELKAALHKVEILRRNGSLGGQKRWAASADVVVLHPDRSGNK
jgi:hypothetical protein